MLADIRVRDLPKAQLVTDGLCRKALVAVLGDELAAVLAGRRCAVREEDVVSPGDLQPPLQRAPHASKLSVVRNNLVCGDNGGVDLNPVTLVGKCDAQEAVAEHVVLTQRLVGRRLLRRQQANASWSDDAAIDPYEVVVAY